MMTPKQVNFEDTTALERITRIIPGYSGIVQQGFFKMLLTDPSVNNILMLGVYHGRDIAIIMDLARRWRPHVPTHVWGVDKFSDDACADWPHHKKWMRWKEAGFGEPPCGVTRAKQNIAQAVGPLPDGQSFTVIESDDAEYLALHARAASAIKFDAVYLDTSHDEATVERQLRQSLGVMRHDGILCGDDYSDESNSPGGSWGVKKAVSAAYPYHTVFGNWIWYVKI